MSLIKVYTVSSPVASCIKAFYQSCRLWWLGLSLIMDGWPLKRVKCRLNALTQNRHSSYLVHAKVQYTCWFSTKEKVKYHRRVILIILILCLDLRNMILRMILWIRISQSHKSLSSWKLSSQCRWENRIQPQLYLKLWLLSAQTHW